MVCVFGPAAQQICLFCAIWHQTQQTAECLLLLWCPIKKEFIAALRASEHYIFFLSSVLLLPHLHFSFPPAGVFIYIFFLPPAAVRQVVRTPHYRPKWAGRVGREHHRARLPVRLPGIAHLSCHLRECLRCLIEKRLPVPILSSTSAECLSLWQLTDIMLGPGHGGSIPFRGFTLQHYNVSMMIKSY